MSSQLDRKKLEALADEPAKEIHTEEDLNALSRYLLKLTVERALKAELDDHLGYKKHDPQGRPQQPQRLPRQDPQERCRGSGNLHAPRSQQQL